MDACQIALALGTRRGATCAGVPVSAQHGNVNDRLGSSHAVRDCDGQDGRFRRILLLAAYPGEGRFTQPTAAVQTWRPELVFMPQSGHRGPDQDPGFVLRGHAGVGGTSGLRCRAERFANRDPVGTGAPLAEICVTAIANAIDGSDLTPLQYGGAAVLWVPRPAMFKDQQSEPRLFRIPPITG